MNDLSIDIHHNKLLDSEILFLSIIFFIKLNLFRGIAKFFGNDTSGNFMVNIPIALTIPIDGTQFALIVMLYPSTSLHHKLHSFFSLLGNNNLTFLLDSSKTPLFKLHNKLLIIFRMILKFRTTPNNSLLISITILT